MDAEELAALADVAGRKRDGGNLRGDVIGDGINLRGGEQRPKLGIGAFPSLTMVITNWRSCSALSEGPSIETTPESPPPSAPWHLMQFNAYMTAPLVESVDAEC